jgi:copper(I)-binding protein
VRRGRDRRLGAGRLVAAAALTAVTTLPGCGASGPELEVQGPYMPEPVMKDMAGGFLTVRNSGGTADELTSVEAEGFGEAQLHTTRGQRMEQVDALTVPADGTLRLDRGGNHIMFRKAERKPDEGEKVRVTLHFRESGDIEVSMPVEATNFVPER